MPADPTLQVVVKLRDLFSKQFKGMTGTVVATSRAVRRTMSRTFGAIGRMAQTALTPFRALTGALFNLKAAIAAVVGAAAIRGLADMAKRADDLRRAFRYLTKSVGVDWVNALRGMRRAAKGTINDIDLMESANSALLLGAAKTAKDLEKMVLYSRRLATAMGKDAAQGFQWFVTGLSRGTPMILDNLGITFKLSEAYEWYGKQVGKTAAEVSELNGLVAIQAYAWKIAEEKVKALGPDVDTLSTAFARVSVEVHKVMQAFADALAPSFESIAKSITSFLDKNRRHIKAFAAWVGGVANAIVAGFLAIFNRLAEGQTTIKRVLRVLFDSIWDYTEKFVGGFFAWLWQRILLAFTTGMTGILPIMAKTVKKTFDRFIGIFTGEGFDNPFTTIWKDAVDSSKEHHKEYLEEVSKLGDALRQQLQTASQRFDVEGVGLELFGVEGIKNVMDQLRKAREQIRAAYAETIEKGAGRSGATEAANAAAKEQLKTRKELVQAAKDYFDAQEELISQTILLNAHQAELGGTFEKVWRSAYDGILRYLAEVGTLSMQLSDMIYGSIRSMESAISDFFYDAIVGKLKDWKDYVKGFLQDVSREISRFASKKLVSELLGSLVSAVGGALGGGGGGGGGNWGEALAGGGSQGLGPRQLQAGGLVTRPTVGLIGERAPEAVVPLSGGRAIPVEMRGASAAGGGVTVNFNISAADGPSVRRMFHQERAFFEGMIQNAIHTSPGFRNSMRQV